MFNIFKKKEPVQQEEKQGNNYPAAVVEIHREFHTAAERLLEDARATILEAGKKDVVKVSRLEKLGFKQAAQVTEARPILKKAELSREQIELVKYYSFNYPNNKFITEAQVEAICKKWNLVCGPVDRYRGYVPEKNLAHMEGFSLKKKELDALNEPIYFVSVPNRFLSDGKWQRADINPSHVKSPDYLRNSWHFCEHMLGEHNTYPRFTKITTHFASPELVKQEIGIQICAPIKDMDTEGMGVKSGYKLFSTHIHVPDPVVLHPVKGGYLILTAWGDEASDENVVNQKFN